MKIEVKTLLVFDEAKERDRLQNVFKGKTRTLLLDILDRFLAGNFEELARVRVGLSRDTAEFLHPVIDKVLTETAMRMLRQAEAEAHPDAPELTGTQGMLADLSGLPARQEGLAYPQYTVL